MRQLLAPILIVCLTCDVPAVLATPPWNPQLETVRQVVDATYIHGIDLDTALELMETESEAQLIQLLESGSSRPDNIIAFLHYLGGPNAREALVRFLQQPPDPRIPENDRALLMVPQALGAIAQRGDSQSLAILLQETAVDTPSELFRSAASAASHPARYFNDLVHMGLRGLAFSGAPDAAQRLRELASGTIQPPAATATIQRSADSALRLWDQLQGTGITRTPSGLSSAGFTAEPKRYPTADDTFDTAHDHVLDYTNHVLVEDPMDDVRLAEILLEATTTVSVADYPEDVACCLSFSGGGTAGTFGADGDGLDIIDDFSELFDVLPISPGRIKIVRMINWCGAPIMNLQGCSYQPGNGMVLVRSSNPTFEGRVWAHEYGHNCDLEHHPQNDHLMYFQLTATSYGLDQAECDALHEPVGAAAALISETGACTGEPSCIGDLDGDQVVDAVDLAQLLGAWNSVDEDPADLNGDGTVNAADLALLLGNWGDC